MCPPGKEILIGERSKPRDRFRNYPHRIWEDRPEVQTDAYFAQNYSGATANGIKVGVYHFSYAETVEDALSGRLTALSILMA